MVDGRLPGRNQFVSHGNRERQIRQPAAVKVSELPASNPELNTAVTMRRDCDPIPGSDLVLDPRNNCVAHRSIIDQGHHHH